MTFKHISITALKKLAKAYSAEDDETLNYIIKRDKVIPFYNNGEDIWCVLDLMNEIQWEYSKRTQNWKQWVENNKRQGY